MTRRVISRSDCILVGFTCTTMEATNLCAFVVEEADHADWHEFRAGSTESTPTQSEHKRHRLLRTQLYDCVEGLIQTTYNRYNWQHVYWHRLLRTQLYDCVEGLIQTTYNRYNWQHVYWHRLLRTQLYDCVEGLIQTTYNRYNWQHVYWHRLLRTQLYDCVEGLMQTTYNRYNWQHVYWHRLLRTQLYDCVEGLIQTTYNRYNWQHVYWHRLLRTQLYDCVEGLIQTTFNRHTTDSMYIGAGCSVHSCMIVLRALSKPPSTDTQLTACILAPAAPYTAVWLCWGPHPNHLQQTHNWQHVYMGAGLCHCWH